MRSFTRALAVAALVAMVNGQANLISAKGNSGVSKALQLKSDQANDAQIINDEEIVANIVNECGRTLLAGNIDIGQNTEDALAAKQITQVTKGSKVEATFKVNAQGAGPFTCDMDQTSNGNGVVGQTALQVQEGKPQNGQLKLTITMPSNMTLIGGSTGDIGTVRCRNKLNFGSCFAVQQTDVTPNKNTPENIQALKSLEDVMDQVAQNVKDFPDVAAASARAKTEEEQGTNVIDALLKNNPQIKEVAQPQAVTGGNAVNNGGNGNGNGGNGNGGNGNGGNRGGRGNAGNRGGNNNNNANTGNANTGKTNNGAARNGGAAGRNRNNNGNNNNNNNAAAKRSIIFTRNPVTKREMRAARRAVAEAALMWAKRVIEEESDY